MARYTTLSYTSGSVSASSTLTEHKTISANYINIVKIKIVPSLAGGTTKIDIYKDDGSVNNLFSTEAFSGSFYYPASVDGATVTEAEEGFLLPYEDEDATTELHIKYTNNDSQAKTYAVTILYEVHADSSNQAVTDAINTFTRGQVIDLGSNDLGLNIQANASQTLDLFNIENSAGTDQFTVDSSYDLTMTGDIAAVNINATTALQLGGTSINTAGTLSNVAYKNQSNAFTGDISIDGSVTLGDASADAITLNGRVSSNITFTTDNSNDVGASGANRPRTMYLGTSCVVPTLNATTVVQLNGTSINTGGTLTNVAYLNQANTFTGNINIHTATSATLTIAEAASSTSHFKFVDLSVNEGTITKTCNSGESTISIDTVTTDGTSQAMVRVFRNTTTTGYRYFIIHKGDGSGDVQHQFQADGHTIVNYQSGNFAVNQAGSSAQLHVTARSASTIGCKINTAATPTVDCMQWLVNGTERADMQLTASVGKFSMKSFDNGAGGGTSVEVQRNSNASTPAAGYVVLYNRAGTAYYLWVDNTGDVRVGTSEPTNANDTTGSVVGTQS